MSAAQLDLFASTPTGQPLARRSDPRSSHLAAASVAAAQNDMEQAVLQAVWDLYLPSTPFQIANRVRITVGDRWDAGGLRSCVSRLRKRGELVQDGEGLSPRGEVCMKLRLPSLALPRVVDVPVGETL